MKESTNYVFLEASIRIQTRPDSEFRQAFAHTLDTGTGAIGDAFVQNWDYFGGKPPMSRTKTFPMALVLVNILPYVKSALYPKELGYFATLSFGLSA